MGFSFLNKQPGKSQTIQTSQPASLSPGVEALLSQKIVLLEELLQNPDLIEEAQKSTSQNSNLSQKDIDALDNKWLQSSETDPYIKQFLNNKTANILIGFQEENPGFVEMFVTDRVGLNVGQTNRTSDYYQADEDWWTGAYNDGIGKAYHGEIEFDESANSESISLYVPIFNNGKNVVGVLKAVLDLTSIQKEL